MGFRRRQRTRTVGRTRAGSVTAFAAALLLVTACASDDAPAADTTVALEDSDLADDVFARTTGDVTDGDGSAADDTASASSSTLAAEPAVPPDPAFPVSITQVDLGDGTITITNHGRDDVDLGGLWLCEFPDYEELDPMIVSGGESVTIPNPHGSVPADGELGLYKTDDFGDADAILSYVEWGSPGHRRAAVAIDAGIWTDAAVEGGQRLGTGGNFAADAGSWVVLETLFGEPGDPPPLNRSSTTTPAPSGSSSPPPDDYGGSTSPPATSAGSASTAPTTAPPDDYSPPDPASAPPAAPPATPPPDEY